MSNIEWCIDYLSRYNNVKVPSKLSEETAFRALQNITMPDILSDEFFTKQDEVLKEIIAQKTITDVSVFPDGISIYLGDITLLRADAIVNACNSKMLGCFVPGHNCIDNAIHSFAGLQVRKDMQKIMLLQGYDEPNGLCKVTKGYNLPCKYIFHTVGPIYTGIKQDETDLKNCYLSCLKKADEMCLNNIVFCSLSTGVFGYPIEKASLVAVNTVKEYLKDENKNIKKVVFDVFSKKDYDVYYKTINKKN